MGIEGGFCIYKLDLLIDISLNPPLQDTMFFVLTYLTLGGEGGFCIPLLACLVDISLNPPLQ